MSSATCALERLPCRSVLRVISLRRSGRRRSSPAPAAARTISRSMARAPSATGSSGRRVERLGRRRQAGAQARHELAPLTQRPGQKLRQVDPPPRHRRRERHRGLGPVLAGRLLDDRGGLQPGLTACRREMKVVARLPAGRRDEVLELHLGGRAAGPPPARRPPPPRARRIPPDRAWRCRPAAGRARRSSLRRSASSAASRRARGARPRGDEVERLPPRPDVERHPLAPLALLLGDLRLGSEPASADRSPTARAPPCRRAPPRDRWPRPARRAA